MTRKRIQFTLDALFFFLKNFGLLFLRFWATNFWNGSARWQPDIAGPGMFLTTNFGIFIDESGSP